MNDNPKILKASIITPFAVLFFPALASVLMFYSKSTGPLDDAPKAVSVLFIFMLPIFYFIIFLFMYFCGILLIKLNCLKKNILYFIALFISLFIGILMSIESPFGTKAQIISFVTLSFILLVCLSLGVFIWWALAFSKQRER